MNNQILLSSIPSENKNENFILTSTETQVTTVVTSTCQANQQMNELKSISSFYKIIPLLIGVKSVRFDFTSANYFASGGLIRWLQDRVITCLVSFRDASVDT